MMAKVQLSKHPHTPSITGGATLPQGAGVRTQTGKNVKRPQRYYVCSGKSKEAQSGLEEKCTSRYAPADQLDELVWKNLCDILTHPESITDVLQRAHGDQWLPQELKRLAPRETWPCTPSTSPPVFTGSQ